LKVYELLFFLHIRVSSNPCHNIVKRLNKTIIVTILVTLVSGVLTLAHGIYNCENCKKITAILIFEKARGKSEIRFNELLRIARRTMPKFSAPTLLRHLNVLNTSMGPIKKTRKGSQNVVYSLKPNWYRQLYSKDELESLHDQLQTKIENLHSLSLHELVEKYLRISEMLAYDNLIVRLENFLKKETSENLCFKMELNRYFYEAIWGWAYDAMNDRDNSEYEKVLIDLKNQLGELRTKLLTK